MMLVGYYVFGQLTIKKTTDFDLETLGSTLNEL
jgi:hypothetical protein